MRYPDRSRGVSLIEALVALAIIALTLTVGLALLAKQSEVTRRARAHREATQIVESTIEEVRGGLIPLTPGRARLQAVSVESDAFLLWLEVLPKEEVAGLSDVLVEARYVVGEQTLRRRVRTMVWGTP